MSPEIVIVADPPWGWCAGLRHPPEASYPAGMFSAAQLEQLVDDPALILLVDGVRLERRVPAEPPPAGAFTMPPDGLVAQVPAALADGSQVASSGALPLPLAGATTLGGLLPAETYTWGDPASVALTGGGTVPAPVVEDVSTLHASAEAAAAAIDAVADLASAAAAVPAADTHAGATGADDPALAVSEAAPAAALIAAPITEVDTGAVSVDSQPETDGEGEASAAVVVERKAAASAGGASSKRRR